MKKNIVLLVLVISTQFISAQSSTDVNPLVTEFIQSNGVSERMKRSKESFVEYVLEENRIDFAKQYDNVIDEFIQKYINIISSNLTDSEIKVFNEAMIEEKEFTSLSKKKQQKFDREMRDLEVIVTKELNELIVKYRNPEFSLE